MGKKTKVGKSRKDKFYQLAKETGYRARSAFKLLQLNRKYEFLQKSRVCIDLCAAPGGWLQVAANHMPVSSLVIGVDLVPIRAIPNVTTLQEDITTDKCRQALRKEMQTWKADVVLNDGAGNVGKNWLHDAFQQATLTLSALKLAVDFLRKGGWFVTKVFRSKDYQSLMWVFQQLFKHVYATKPQASRNESAEIFVVCQGFIAPDKMDSKFTDPKYVFKDVTSEPSNLLNLVHPEKLKKHARGYADGDNTLHHKVLVTEFLSAENHLELLADCHELVLDDEAVREHPLTTAEIKECCKDIKVLGKKEIRSLLNWRKKLKKDQSNETKDVEMVSASESEDEESKLERQLHGIQAEQLLDMKRKKKKVQKEKKKLRDKMTLKMVIPGDRIDTTDDIALFDLANIKSKHGLNEVEKGEAHELDDQLESDDDSDTELPLKKKQMMAYDRYGNQEDEEEDEEEDNSEEEEEEEASEDESDEDNDVEMEEADSNPLVIDLADKPDKPSKQAQMWFQKDVFSGLANDADEDFEITKMTEEYTRQGGVVLDKTKKNQKKKRKHEEVIESGSDSGHESEASSACESDRDEDDSDSDDDSDYDINDTLKQSRSKNNEQPKTNTKSAKKDGFEIVPITKLDPIGLAIGEELVKSKKRRREIMEQSYNRYTFNDVNLPDWFVKEESRHSKKQMPVSKEQVQEYRERMRAIDARPIKKVAESKARKKKKSLKKLENVRKRADAISDTVDVSDKEKMQQIKQIYKKAGLLKKQKEEVTYVVAKKGVGKRVRRPAGVKGRFKVVDPRMKKDIRKQKSEAAQAKKKKGKGKTRR